MASAKQGWRWGGSRFGRNSPEDDAAVAHRKEMEKEGLTRLAEAMRPLMEGFELEVEPGNYGSYIQVSLEGLKKSKKAQVKFRYSDHGFGDKGSCEGISVKCDGERDYSIDTLGRAYGYDFDKGCMKPASLTKMTTVLGDHMRKLLETYQRAEARRTGAIGTANTVKPLLEEEGYTVFVDDDTWSLERVDIRISRGEARIIDLRIGSDGTFYSAARFERLPIRANTENIVEVVKAIESLKQLMEG